MIVGQRMVTLLIDGQPAPAASGKTFAVINPATGETVAAVAEADGEDPLSPRQSAARPRRRAGQAGGAVQRQAHHRRTAEVNAAADCFEYYAGAATKWVGETIPVTDRGLDFTLREPIGVVGLIVPWNFPLMIASWKVAPALAAGNTARIWPA